MFQCHVYTNSSNDYVLVGSARLPLNDLLDHMKLMMEGRRTKDWATTPYTHILIGDVLPVAHCTLNISLQGWEGKNMSLQNHF